MNFIQSICLNHIKSSFLNMTTMAERFQHALDARRLTPPDVIRGTGLSKGTIYNILNETTSPEKIWGATAKRICTFMRISSDWLLTGRGSMDEIKPTQIDDAVDVPGFAHSLALGDGSTPEEYAETHSLKFRASSLRRKGLLGKRLEVYYGRGDSMESRIHDGDAILVDRDDVEPKDGEIFVLEGDFGAMAKRLTQIDGRWYFESDNKSDPKWRKPTPLHGKNHYTIAGRVRWIASWEG